MTWSQAQRDRRRHRVKTGDQRDQSARDRDRILYSSNFHRLAGITQIVRAGEADYFHTRQQHTMKVAQVGRRLAEHCRLSDTPLADAWGVDPEVVEAACLAHDLGHPPFGHIGEYTLDRLVEQAGDLDGPGRHRRDRRRVDRRRHRAEGGLHHREAHPRRDRRAHRLLRAALALREPRRLTTAGLRRRRAR